MGGSPFCPFCKGAISADLAQFGGNCPHCLLEVPGEDAPTDPGALLRAKQAEEEGKRRKAEAARRRVRYAVFGALGVLGVAVGGWYSWSQQQLATYELDDYYVVPVEELATAPTPAVAEPVAAPTTGGTSSTRKPAGTKTTTPAPTTSAPTAIASRPDTRDAIPAEVMAMTSGTTGSVALGASVGIDLGTPGLVLESDEDIIAMAKQVINRSSPQLQACYQQRLRQVSDLAGAWKVEFVITEAGGVRSIDVEGTDRSDGELEACITRAIGGWKFTKIAHDQRVSKTYRFKPAGG